MTEREIFSLLLALEFAISLPMAWGLWYFSAPYGRYFHQARGPQLNAKISWFLMEVAAIISFDVTYFAGERAWNPISLIFFTLWQIHYVDRSIIYPWRLPATSKRLPIAVLLPGLFFNLGNGYLNARFLSEFGSPYTYEWLTQPCFLIGIALFFGGFLINRHADTLLLRLRKPGETDYKIPHGIWFDYVSCPNYLGEIIEWFGWALAAWSLPGLAFALFTAANLIPRAYTHHVWYRERFPDYPKERKAILPFVF